MQNALTVTFYYLITGLFILMVQACADQDASVENQASKPIGEAEAVEVYDMPRGKVIAKLFKDETLRTTGRVSERLFTLYTPHDTFFEPYLEVLLPDGRAGWTYARPDKLPLAEKTNLLDWQAENRIHALLGKDHLRDYHAYRQLWDHAQNGKPSNLLIQAYRSARSIRDELQQILAIYPEQPLSAAQWEAMLPGFLCQLDETSRPNWWIDYRQWLSLAEQLRDQEATTLFGIYCQVYPQDSIEYFYPVWQIAESRTVQHSLLGRGIHTRLLRALVPTQLFTSLAGTEAGALYEDILDDILQADNTYWEAPVKIIAELDTLLQGNDPSLDQVLTENLQARRRVFTQNTSNTNLRAGQLAE